MGAQKTTLFGSIFLLNGIFKGIIDMILIPVLMSKLGYIVSLTLTTLIYLFIGIVTIKIYDFYKIDCLMIEALKKSQYNNTPIENNGVIVKLILKWAQKNKIVLEILLASQNTGLVVIYLRDGFYSYNGFYGKNIKLFFFIYSFVISIYWNTVIYIGNQAIKGL